MVAIAPSILAANMACLATEVKAVAPYADYIHLDVMDGHFVDNLSFGPGIIQSLRRATTKPFDVHLMITEPEKWITRYAEAGADIISIHVEACSCIRDTLIHIRSLGKKAGIAINPETSIDVTIDLLNNVDIVVVMSVNPGFGGQKYIPYTNDKLSALRSLTLDKNILLEVDGGINVNTATLAIRSGADILVAGSSIFSQNDYAVAIKQIRKNNNEVEC